MVYFPKIIQKTPLNSRSAKPKVKKIINKGFDSNMISIDQFKVEEEILREKPKDNSQLLDDFSKPISIIKPLVENRGFRKPQSLDHILPSSLSDYCLFSLSNSFFKRVFDP